MIVVYFSSVSGYTKRFVEGLPFEHQRLPLYNTDEFVEMDEPYVLITPTYGQTERNAVPRQVIKFLNNEKNRSLIRGVVACGNTNFGNNFGISGDVISMKAKVPLLAKIELFGMPGDVELVTTKIKELGENT